MRGPTLRLVCVNDVYSLEHLAHLRGLVQHFTTHEPADALIVTLAGDFVAPSLLSSLDKGAGMVDCLNAVPVTHVIFGNHEDDVPFDALVARVKQFRGVWLNSNLPGFPVPLPAQQVLSVTEPGGRTVRVGLLGVVTSDPTMFRPNPFGGLAIAPAQATVLARAATLVRDDGCACVVPLTHQSLAEDHALAEACVGLPVPLIVGGHEHEPYVELQGATWIVKAGAEAVRAMVVDLAWPAVAPAPDAPDLPTVRVRAEVTDDYPADVALQARAEVHMRAVNELNRAVLMRVPHVPGRAPLSSVGTRVQQTSVGAMLCGYVRDALGAEACVINGGGIRGARDYPETFTYGDLESELPFPNEIVTVSMPGAVLRDAVAASRLRVPVPSAGFLQVDDGVVVAEDGRTVTAVGGAPLDPARMYCVATVRVLFDGMDSIEPLVRFARETPARVPAPDSGRELKMIVVDAFARALWRELGGFEAVDANRDGVVVADEVRAAIARATHVEPAEILVKQILAALDEDGDAKISPNECRCDPR